MIRMTRHLANVAFFERQEPDSQFSLHYERRSCIYTGRVVKESRSSAKRNELRIGSNIGDNVIELLSIVWEDLALVIVLCFRTPPRKMIDRIGPGGKCMPAHG